MQRKILMNLIAVSLCGILLTTVALYIIQTVTAQKSANETTLLCLNNITERVLQNQNEIDNVLNGIAVGSTGYVFSVDERTGLISSHPNKRLIDTMPPASLDSNGFMTIDGYRVLYSARRFEGQILAAVIPVNEIYSQRSSYTLAYMAFTIVIFGAFCAIVSGYIKRNVVNGILRIVSTLQEISSGNLDVVADIRSSNEFEKLSDGINHMLYSTKAKIDEIAALADSLNRYGAIISTSGAGVIIKDRDGIITDWNIGAQNILGYTPEEMLGNTSDSYADRSQAEELADVYRRVDLGETIADIEIKGVHKNGSSIICSTSLSPFFDPQGNVSGSVIIFRDVTSERLADQKVKNLAAIVSIADAGIIVKDKYGLVREWNIGAENILGYTAEEIIGNPTEYYAPNSAHVLINKVEQGLRRGEHIAHVEVVREHRDGRLIDCSASYTPIFDDDGKYAGSVSVFHDISDKKRMEHALKDAVIAAEEASRAKSAFLANMSHEIRTPMNGVIGFAELALDDESINPKTRDYFKKIKISAEGLLQIINAVLDISKIEAGKVDIEKIPFSITDVFKHCETVFAPKAEEKGVVLYSYIEPPIINKLLGDPTKLRQVLLNLLSNAIKFTSEGMVKLMAIVRQTDENKATIHFEVKDEGIGMTGEQLKKIFEPFIQADATTTRKYGGTGLGLAIAKSLIELMGGELTVESVVGAGSKFSFELIFETLATVDTPVTDESSDTEIKKPTFAGDVLICEDNAINQQVIQEHLSRIGFTVTITENGKQAVEAVKSRADNPFDLIFMDIHMPVMDGLEASKKLRNAGCKTPIVALTANAMVRDKEIYLSSGMSGYLTKPFSAKELWACVLKFLVPVATTTVTQHTVSESVNSTAIIDRNLGIEQAAGNSELYNSLLTDFVTDNGMTLDKIKNAVAGGDIKFAHRLAHTLKGVAGLIGAVDLKNAARDIEKSLSDGNAQLASRQIEVLEKELNAVIAELAPLVPSENELEFPVGELDVQRAREIVLTLEPLLETGDSKCLNFLKEVKSIFAPLGTQGSLFASQIANYDFELAYETLLEIKTYLG